MQPGLATGLGFEKPSHSCLPLPPSVSTCSLTPVSVCSLTRVSVFNLGSQRKCKPVSLLLGFVAGIHGMKDSSVSVWLSGVGVSTPRKRFLWGSVFGSKET